MAGGAGGGNLAGEGIAIASRVSPLRLVQVTYVSTATRALEEDELQSLAAAALAANTARSLTGFLFHQPPKFFGLLEGPERNVLARMESIIADPRHRDLTVLREEAVSEQRFRNWSFGLLPAPSPGGIWRSPPNSSAASPAPGARRRTYR